MSNAVTALFRKCPVTGLRVYKDAENMIKVNAVTAIVFFLVECVFMDRKMGCLFVLIFDKRLLPSQSFSVFITVATTTS